LRHKPGIYLMRDCFGNIAEAARWYEGQCEGLVT
jgi:hypothetical protein